MYLSPIDEPKEDTECPVVVENTDQTDIPSQKPTSTKYCIGCNHEFSHRSAYLRHIRRIHHGVYPTEFDEPINNNLIEVNMIESIKISNVLSLCFDRLTIVLTKHLCQL